MPELDEPLRKFEERQREAEEIPQSQIDRLEQKLNEELHGLDSRLRKLEGLLPRVDTLESYYTSLIPLSLTSILGFFGLGYGFQLDSPAVIFGSLGLLAVVFYLGWRESGG